MDLDRAGAVLDGVVEQVDEDLLNPVAVAGGGPDVRRDLDLDRSRLWKLGPSASTVSPTMPAMSTGSESTGSSPRSSRLVSRSSSVIWLSRAACVAIISSSCRRRSGRELDVFAEQRLGRAVDGRHRRAQLVRDRRDEVGLLLLEPVLARDVAAGVDHAVRRADGREREPEILLADLKRKGHRPGLAAVLGDRNASGRAPATRGGGHRARCPRRALRRQAGQELGCACSRGERPPRRRGGRSRRRRRRARGRPARAPPPLRGPPPRLPPGAGAPAEGARFARPPPSARRAPRRSRAACSSTRR